MVGQIKWLRRLVRKKMMPIPEDEAYKWKSRLSWAYMFCAWNALGAVAYAAYNGKLDWADYYGLKTEEEKALKNNEFFAKNIGRAGNVKLVTMKGFTTVESRDFDYKAEVTDKQNALPDIEMSPAQKVQRRQQQLEAELRRQSAEESPKE